MKKIFNLLAVLMLMAFMVVGCGAKNEDIKITTDEQTTEQQETVSEKTDEASKIGGSIILSTTTSTENSGLLNYILPDFTEKTGRSKGSSSWNRKGTSNGKRWRSGCSFSTCKTC